MNKKIQIFIASAAIFGLAIMFGCASIPDILIPCNIPQASINYAGIKATSFLPYTSLWDAQRIDAQMDYIYGLLQITNRMEYEFLKTGNKLSMVASTELKRAIFSVDGPVGLIFPTLMGTTIGALLIKRPGDKSVKNRKA